MPKGATLIGRLSDSDDANALYENSRRDRFLEHSRCPREKGDFSFCGYVSQNEVGCGSRREKRHSTYKSSVRRRTKACAGRGRCLKLIVRQGQTWDCHDQTEEATRPECFLHSKRGEHFRISFTSMEIVNCRGIVSFPLRQARTCSFVEPSWRRGHQVLGICTLSGQGRKCKRGSGCHLDGNGGVMSGAGTPRNNNIKPRICSETAAHPNEGSLVRATDGFFF